MFDVFYLGKKPNLFPHERPAESVEHAQELSRTRFFWIVNYLSDYSGFDFLWEPVPWQSHQRHAWPSQWQKDSETYLISKTGYTETNYHTDVTVTRLSNITAWHIPNNIDPASFDFSWHPDPADPPMTYCFGTQWQRSGGPKYLESASADIKFINQPRARAMQDKTLWQIPHNVDTDSFDFSWHPDTIEPAYLYQFGTQWQKTGGPRYVMPGATEIKYVTQTAAKVTAENTAIVEIDHMDGHTGHIPNTVRQVRYFDNYRDTLIRVANNLKGKYEYVWVCSSICDYTDFDFSWHPESWQSTMLHVFASNEQKFGDTFFIHVPTFAEQAEKKALLDWYDVNYVPKISVPRRPMPVIQHTSDTHVEQVKNAQWAGPLALFTNGILEFDLPAVNLWRANTKTIVPLNHSASAVIVPQAAIPCVKTQLYDYPVIDKTHRLKKDQAIDVIFISYDEPDAEKNWAELKNKTPRAKRVHGVSGMELALEAAADQSSTPWYYAVFAKTKIHENFDFSFVPDYMQQPKHYIFDCLNTVNQLQYGHMGIVMYNCQGIKTLNQQKNFGLDYTLSFPHESIPMLSCYGNFDQSPYHTWRTAFREAAKLAYFESVAPSVDGAYRLGVWQTRASGQYAEWCLAGARDGVEFFNTSNKELAVLKQSFEWRWLRSYFVSKYGELE